MTEDLGFKVGGLEKRYTITRADGTPCPELARYFVLNCNGQDPHALVAARAYADSVSSANPQLAAELRAMVEEVELANLQKPAPRPCGNPECCCTTNIMEDMSFGYGDETCGFWEFPCYVCARDWEERNPGKRAHPYRHSQVMES